MKKMIFTVLILTLPSLGFMACEDRAGDGAKTTDSANPMSNAELENSIKSRLDGDDQLKAANLKVNADRDRKVATLSGTVESESLRSKAIDLAKSVQPDVLIQDQIEITPTEVSRKDYTKQMAKEEWAKAKQLGEKVGGRLDDAWIHGKIVAKLIANSKTSQRTVSVDVDNNVVTLRGTVPDAEQKTEAERIAKETDGVKRVDNRLNVSA
jgi:osmotically-inducible protein OsmY